MSYVIERKDEGLPIYFSLKVAGDYGQPGGGWAEMKHALQFGRACDADRFAKVYLKEMAPWCEAVPYAEEV